MSWGERVKCQHCGSPNGLKGTKMCDGCWELAHRVRHERLDALKSIFSVERPNLIIDEKEAR